MPLKDGQLTRREVTFAEVYARTGDLEYAEDKAGYSRGGSRQVLARTGVQDRIFAEQQARVTSEALPLVVEGDLHNLRRPETPGFHKSADRVAKWLGLFDREGGASQHKEPHEMTAEELHAHLEKALARKEEIIGQAKDVTPPDPFD